MMSPESHNVGPAWPELGPAITATPSASVSPAISLLFRTRAVPVIDPSVAFDDAPAPGRMMRGRHITESASPGGSV